MPAIARVRARPQPVQTAAGRTGRAGPVADCSSSPRSTRGLVAVLGTEDAPIVRMRQSGMFASGSATRGRTNPSPLLDRIGEALKAEPGSVQVVGYTDDQPIRTVRFPSNFQLSAARAAAAGAIIAQAMGDPGRVCRPRAGPTPIPIAPNTTPEGREANRRIEIVLHRQGSCRQTTLRSHAQILLVPLAAELLSASACSSRWSGLFGPVPAGCWRLARRAPRSWPWSLVWARA